jgi:DNA-binding MarR family transcriptional regulator
MPINPDDSPVFLLWHVTLRWQRDVTAALAPLDLTHVQFVLLASVWWLHRQGSEPNQLAAARHAGTDVKMTSEVVRKLEAKGLITREVDPSDTRARRLRPTERGAALAQQAIGTVEAVDAAFFQAVSRPAALLATLRELASGDETRS